ncbi:hypothetical protein L6452_15872 [Arctium lappa]|uniref:Uncharacterized protein n=1 Tax=Arctium lappa TaxID=4217 RepID=A0ACB9CQ75_ARCLA|nr:hypothetical protein L6452_15872 [Arctium lappa]
MGLLQSSSSLISKVKSFSRLNAYRNRNYQRDVPKGHLAVFIRSSINSLLHPSLWFDLCNYCLSLLFDQQKFDYFVEINRSSISRDQHRKVSIASVNFMCPCKSHANIATAFDQMVYFNFIFPVTCALASQHCKKFLRPGA